MNKAKRSKKKLNSDDQFNMNEDYIYSQTSPIQQQISYDAKKNNYSTKKNQIQQKKNDKLNEKKITEPKGLSIQQIKQQILTHTPDMREQIDILDDETLREIYYSIVQPSQKNIMEEERKIDFNQNSPASQHLKQPESDNLSKKRSPQIQKMIDQIVNNVPHMKNQVQIFNDEEIQQLYQSVGFSQNVQFDSKPQVQSIPITTKNNFDIRKFLQTKIPQMKDQLKYLSDQDLLEVYGQYIQKEKPSIQSKPLHNNSKSQFVMSQIEKMPIYDPLKKFQNKSGIKLQNSISGYPQKTRGGLSWFNNYKHSGQNRNNDFFIAHNKATSHTNPYVNSPSSNIQVHNFHNSQRVGSIDYNSQKYARTVVIFHTMDPGYCPPNPRTKCKCPCCVRRQNQMNSSDVLNGFIYSMMNRSISRK